MLGTLVAVSCQVSSDILYGAIYFCDGTALAETCGTTREGAPMTCYMARQIGARDFCTERCTEERADAERPGWRCVDTQARLRTCRPSDPTPCPHPETACLRTNLLDDEGVCVTMSTCSVDHDCRDTARPVCMGPMIQAFYGNARGILSDHSSCLQKGCIANRTSCGAGESCLPLVLPTHANMDICVPNCDRDLNCPPNYFCYRKVSGPANPAVCIPGILGFRCTSSMDCLIGECTDTGAGFHACLSRCGSDDDCARFSTSLGVLVCVAAPGGDGRKFCQSPNAYNGANCHPAAPQCQPHETCVTESPYYRSTMMSGECRPRCGPGLPCVNRGGVPHVCVEGAEGGGWCYPGRIHLPCERDADCVGTLRCLEVASRNRQDGIDRRKRCTVPCSNDGDCKANRLTEGVTYCNKGVCSPRLHSGMLCGGEDQCHTTCAPVPGVEGVMRCT